MDDILKIHPEMEFSASCPLDQTALTMNGIVIPGMRSLVDAVCPRCDARFFVDLPVSHALWNASTTNQQTLEQYNTREANWFSEHMLRSLRNRNDSEVIPVVHKFFDADRIIILNCIDYLYGHALLKLLNAQRHLENHPALGLCVLVPSQLTHLVPDGVAEIWELPVPITESGRWFPSLERWLNETIGARKECFLSRAYSHPSNRVYDLQRFVRDLPDVSELLGKHRPVILFSYREDRLWGDSLKHQEANLAELCNGLSAAFSRAVFVVVGFGKQNQIHTGNMKLLDLRVKEFSRETDRLWLATMQRADCSVGVLGSNMLLPSGLSRSTVDLVPRNRSYNLFQDVLFTDRSADVRSSFLKYRFLNGNETLSDVSATHVLDAVTSILANNERSSYWFRFGESETEEFAPERGEIAAEALRYRRELRERKALRHKEAAGNSDAR